MKNLLFALIVIVSIASCTKEKVTPPPPVPPLSTWSFNDSVYSGSAVYYGSINSIQLNTAKNSIGVSFLNSNTAAAGVYYVTKFSLNNKLPNTCLIGTYINGIMAFSTGNPGDIVTVSYPSGKMQVVFNHVAMTNGFVSGNLRQ